MLTPEDQKRIEEEERYRSSLRSIRRSQALGRLLAIPVILGALWITAALILSVIRGAPVSPFPAPPVVHPIARGPVSVPPLTFLSYKFAVPDGGGHITGSFSAFGGLGNDIRVAVTDSDNQSRIWWSTGPQSNGQVDVRVPPGMYTLVLDNRMALLSSKQVTIVADVSY